MSGAEAPEQKSLAQQLTEKSEKPSYKDILDALKQKQAAEREAKERQLQKKIAANPEEYMVKSVLESVPSGDVKIAPGKTEKITVTVPLEDVTSIDRPTISFPYLSDKPLSLGELVSAFKSTGKWLDGSQVVTLKNKAIDIQNAIIVEVQEGKTGNWEYLYNKAVELEAIAQEQINNRLPMPAEKTESLPQTGVTIEDLKSKKIVPHMVRDRAEILRNALEEMPGYQRAKAEAREEAKEFAEKMDHELRNVKPIDFIDQILQKEAQFLSGETVNFSTSESETLSVQVEDDGTVSVSMPANVNMTHLVQLAGEFSRIFPGQTSSDTRIGQFARQLEDTALLLAQRGGFSAETLETVYNTGQQLQQLLNPDSDTVLPRSFSEIQELAASRSFTQEERQKLITEMILGRGVVTTSPNGSLQQSAFDRLYTRWEKSHPGESPDVFITEYLDPRDYRLDFLKPYIETSIQNGGTAYNAMQEISLQRAHESIAQSQVDSWIESVRSASGFHNTEFTQTIHGALAQARAEAERVNIERAANGETLLTVDEVKVREIEAVTHLLQSPEIADELTYAPAEIRALLALPESPSGEEALWEAACNIKAAFAKSAFEKLGYQVGVKRDGTHRYLLIKAGDKVLEVDVTTPREVEENGDILSLSGVTEITDQVDQQNALIDIARQDGNQILISSIYNNVAMQLRATDGDAGTIEVFLRNAIQADPENDVAAYGLYIATGDLSMRARALRLNPFVEQEWKREEGFIGAYLDNTKFASVAQPAVSDPVMNNIVLDMGTKGAAGLIDKEYIRSKQMQVNSLIGNRAITNPPDVLTVSDYLNKLEGVAITEDKMEQQALSLQRSEEHQYDGIENVDLPAAKDAYDYVQNIIKKNQPRDLARETRAVSALNQMIDKTSLDGDRYPTMILELSGYFDETRERVLNQILFKSFEDPSELNDYDISFYADPRYRKMHSSFKTAAILARQAGDTYKANQYMERYNFYVGLRTAVKVSHGMNKLVNVGEIGALSKVAQEMNKEHFALMAQVPGQGYVMELYEKEYTRLIARDKRISPEGYDEIKRNVQAKMKDLNKSGVVRSQFESQRSGPDAHIMQDWEIQRAYSAGRAMYNMFLRSSMHISFSQITEGIDYGTSYPQGRIVETLNPWDTLFERWGMGSEWGGPKFVEQDTVEWYKAMKDYNYIQGINKIYMLGNKSIDSIQKAAQLKFVDFLSGFRINNIAFPVIYIDDPADPNKQISLKAYLDSNDKIITALQKGANSGNVTQKNALNRHLQSLVDATDLGLGALLMHKSFLNSGENSNDTYEARKYLWAKVARTNLPLMTDYLTGLSFVERDENGVVIKDAAGDPKKTDMFDVHGNKILSLEEIIKAEWGYNWEDMKDETATSGPAYEWRVLTDKMQHNRMVFEQKAMLKNTHSKVALAEQAAKAKGGKYVQDEIAYTAKEQAIVDAIQRNAEALAPHLADVYWNNIPFLDVPCEELDYKQLGSDEYRRKVAGDHSQLYTAFSSLIAIAKKPASQDAKTFAENMKPIVDNLEDVDGGLVAQQNTYPISKIVFEWKMMDKGSRFALLHSLKNLTNTPNSEAQRLQGIHAEALDEFGVNDEIDDLMKAGILTPAFAKKLKKELGTRLWGLIWNILRDAGFMLPYIVAEPLIGESMKFE